MLSESTLLELIQMTTDTPIKIGELITCTPGVYGGRPCIRGTRMPVHVIALAHREGLDAEGILEGYPHLDIVGIYAALAYYYANKADIDRAIEADAALYDELAAKYPHGWTRETHRP